MSDTAKTWAEIEGAQKEMVYGLLLDQGGGLMSAIERRGKQGMSGSVGLMSVQVEALKAALEHLGYVRPEAPRIQPAIVVPAGGRHGARRKN